VVRWKEKRSSVGLKDLLDPQQLRGYAAEQSKTNDPWLGDGGARAGSHAGFLQCTST
jgi:hypothetical protein